MSWTFFLPPNVLNTSHIVTVQFFTFSLTCWFLGFDLLFLYLLFSPSILHSPNSTDILFHIFCLLKQETPAFFFLFALDHMIDSLSLAFTCIHANNPGDITLMSLVTVIVPQWPMLWGSDPSLIYGINRTIYRTGVIAFALIYFIWSTTPPAAYLRLILILFLAYVHLFYHSSPTSL